MFDEGRPEDTPIHKSALLLTGQGKEQIVIFQYEACSSQVAMIFGYDLYEKKIVQYFVGNYGSETFIPVGSTRQFLDKGKPEGILQNRVYTQVWGTLLVRYRFDPINHRFQEIPMIVGFKRQQQPDQGRLDLALYEDGYLTDIEGQGKDTFLTKSEVFHLLNSQEANVYRLLEKLEQHSDFGGRPPHYDFFFSSTPYNVFVSCGEESCPKEVLFVKDRILEFWQKRTK